MRTRRAMLAVLLGGLLVGAITAPVPAASSSTTIETTLRISPFDSLCDVGMVQHSYAGLGAVMAFTNQTGSKKTVKDKNGFWSFSVAKGGVVDKTMSHAGTYQFTCSGGSTWTKIPVHMSGPSSASGSFKLTWATSGASSNYHYAVQYKIGSSGAIKIWKSSTSSRSATFNPGHHGVDYYFQTETLRTSSAKSGWSSWLKVSVS